MSLPRSGPFLFSVDMQSRPGRVICHAVRFETYEFGEAEFEETKFDVLDDFRDPRIPVLRKVVMGVEEE